MTFIRVMVKVQGLVVLVLLLASAAVGSAQPKAPNPPLVGATEAIKLVPPAGFVDDAIAVDAQRLAYVVSDSSGRSELHVISFAPRVETTFDLVPVTSHPTALALAGNRVLVVGAGEEDKQVAALVDLGGKDKPASIAYKLGPASHITVVTRDGKQRIAVHRTTPTKDGTKHDLELLALDTGKRVAAGPGLELDNNNASKAHDFRVNHWLDGMTRAVGLKGGDWDRKENQRTPDVEATFDLVTGKFETKKIDDVMEQRKRYQTLVEMHGQVDFLRMTWDNSAVQLWRAGKPRSLELDEKITSYDPKSLQGVVLADGTAWFSLSVDPVNPDAVARKKADPEYLDVFHVGSDGKATRKARVLASNPGARYRFGLVGDKFWLVERSPMSDRGGKNVAVYTVQ